MFLKDIVEDRPDEANFRPDGPQSKFNFEKIYGFFKPINRGL
jgi:hypothetical protein